MTLQPTPLQDAYRYTKGQFRHTVCADCLASLEPCVEDNNKVVVEHWCRVSKRRFVVDMGSSEDEARAAVARLDYLDIHSFPRAGFPDFYTTVNHGALLYHTLIRVNGLLLAKDANRIMAQVPCELVIRTHLPLEFSFDKYHVLTNIIFGLQHAYREALLCRANRHGRAVTYLPKFRQQATLHFGHKRISLTMPIYEFSSGVRNTWATDDLALSARDCAKLFGDTLPFRYLAAVRGVAEAEERYLEEIL